MIIEPNEQGWSISNQGPWQLIFNEQYIIKLIEAGVGTSTQEKLFVGTEEECKNKAAALGLPLASNDSLGEIQKPALVVPPLPDENF